MLTQNEGTVFLLKRNLILLFAITFLQGMVFYAPVAVLYRQAAGVTVLQMTVIEGISLLLSVALEIPWGIAAEKIGYRNTMIFCCLLYFVSKLIFWQAVDFGGFLLEQTHQAVTVIVNQLQYQRSGIGASWFGVILAGMNLLGLLGVFSKLYTACLGEKWAGGSLLLLSAGSCVVLALTENPVLSVVGVALVHLAFSLFVPLQTELQNRRVVTSARATELSVQSAFLNGTGAAVGVVFGRGAESSVPLAFWLGAALCLSAWCLFQLTVSGKRA